MKSKAVDNFSAFKTADNNLGSVFFMCNNVKTLLCVPQFSTHRVQSSTLLIAYPNTFRTSFPDLFP
jgi:hypothetical protein